MSPAPLSGSLLVAETSVNRSGPDSESVSETATEIATSLWFGGQIEPGDAEHVSAGAVVSMLIPRCVSLALFPAASVHVAVADWFAPSVVTVRVTVAGA